MPRVASLHALALTPPPPPLSVKCDIGKHIITASGESMTKLNPKGNVPALILADGTVLNEGASVLQWIGDNSPAESHLVPANGTTGRYVVQNVLSFLGTELHASFGPLFGPGSDEAKTAQRAKVATKLVLLESILGDKQYLTGANPTIADYYAYIIMSWAQYVSVDLKPYAKANAFAARVAALPKVIEAHAAMNAAA